jgi:hypothetical protein
VAASELKGSNNNFIVVIDKLDSSMTFSFPFIANISRNASIELDLSVYFALEGSKRIHLQWFGYWQINDFVLDRDMLVKEDA